MVVWQKLSRPWSFESISGTRDSQPDWMGCCQKWRTWGSVHWRHSASTLSGFPERTLRVVHWLCYCLVTFHVESVGILLGYALSWSMSELSSWHLHEDVERYVHRICWRPRSLIISLDEVGPPLWRGLDCVGRGGVELKVGILALGHQLQYGQGATRSISGWAFANEFELVFDTARNLGGRALSYYDGAAGRLRQESDDWEVYVLVFSMSSISESCGVGIMSSGTTGDCGSYIVALVHE